MRDAPIRTALADAHLPSLLVALGMLTGEWDEIAALLPARLRVVDEQGGMTASEQAAATDYAAAVLDRLRDGDLPAASTDPGEVERGLQLLLGDDYPTYREMSLEELAISDPDPRAPDWRVPGGETPPDHRAGGPGESAEPADSDVLDVVVIGAGMSGLLAAHRLAQAGVRFLILERNAGVGGTWFTNAYPGCRVDVPSHLYSYSCLSDLDWADSFATRDQVQAGLERFAQDHQLRGHIRLEHEVTAARWDETRQLWQVEVSGGAPGSGSGLGPGPTPGSGPGAGAAATTTLSARALVSAVGQLNRPHIPDIPGAESFAGPRFHPAAWDPDAELSGRRVAVIGTGASAIQVITGLLEQGADVDVFQRSAAWLFPTPELRRPVPDGLRQLLASVPTYDRWYRLWLQRSVSDGLLPFAECDPQWGDPRSVSAPNDTMRRAFSAYIEAQFGADPGLLAQMLPTYPPFAKRVIRDDGSYARAFLHDGAQLISDAITEITPAGIRTADGTEHPCDAIVYATGFQAARYLVPMTITGRDGVDLRDERWASDASAYLGMAVPQFPNLFLLYGPNTNIVVNGSIIFFSECQVRLLLDALRRIVTEHQVLEVTEEAHAAFVAEVDAQNATRAWGCAGVRNWYLSPSGRVSQNWPGTVLEYWRRTRAVDPGAFHIHVREDSHA